MEILEIAAAPDQVRGRLFGLAKTWQSRFSWQEFREW
jgi:hypothetical protein